MLSENYIKTGVKREFKIPVRMKTGKTIARHGIKFFQEQGRLYGEETEAVSHLMDSFEE